MGSKSYSNASHKKKLHTNHDVIFLESDCPDVIVPKKQHAYSEDPELTQREPSPITKGRRNGS